MKKIPEEHVNHERYLVTYSDLITLLLALFIIMYAMAVSEEATVESFMDQFSLGFNPSLDSISPALNSKNEISERKYRETITEEEKNLMSSTSEQNSLREVQKEIEEEISNRNLEGKIETKLTDAGLKIILTDEILFNSGSAVINNKQSSDLIKEIGNILTQINNPVSIDGHTDNTPIKNTQFSSNWELSSARSLSVLNTILNSSLEESRFSSTGYGEYRPIADNNTEEGKKINRRVEILVKRTNQSGLFQPQEGSETI